MNSYSNNHSLESTNSMFAPGLSAGILFFTLALLTQIIKAKTITDLKWLFPSAVFSEVWLQDGTIFCLVVHHYFMEKKTFFISTIVQNLNKNSFNRERFTFKHQISHYKKPKQIKPKKIFSLCLIIL